VRHGEDDAGFLDDLGQLLGLGQVEGERLVAQDVEAGLAKALAISKWVWLGVATETKSMRSPAGRFNSAATIS